MVDDIICGASGKSGDLAELLEDLPPGLFEGFHERIHGGGILAAVGMMTFAFARRRLLLLLLDGPTKGPLIIVGRVDQVCGLVEVGTVDIGIATQPLEDFIAAPEHIAVIAEGIEGLLGLLLLLQDGGLALAVVEEEGGETIAGAGVDDQTAKPPAQTGWAHEQGVDVGQRNGKGVQADGVFGGGGCGGGGGRGKGRDEVALAGEGGFIRQVDFDVGIVGIAEGGFGDPGEEIGG